MVRLKDIMTRDVVRATPDMTIRDSMQLLSERHLSGAPVVDGGKVVGVFSASDLLAFLADLNDTTPSLTFRQRKGRTSPLEDVTVGEVMTRKIQWLAPDCSIDEAAALMGAKQIHRVLIMQGDMLLGIVTTSDVAKAVAEHRTGKRTYVFAKRKLDPGGTLKRRTLFIVALGTAVLSLGCAFRAPKTEISADDFDLTPLIGEWTGEYSSEETERSGDISFTLRAAERDAFGYVEMVARKPVNVVVATDRPVVNRVPAIQARELLTIHFVRKEGNKVVGVLDPYTSPECACRVTTTFEGVFTNHRTIEGTYSTISSELAHTPTGGQWKVTRAKRL